MTPTEDYKAGETQALLSELNRVKVLFQARAVAAVLGVAEPDQPSVPSSTTKENDMNIGEAIAAMKDGKRVRRSGWNGKGMWIALQVGSDVPLGAVKPGSPLAAVANETDAQVSGQVTICPHIDMRAADGSLVIGWLASQTDLLSDDWELAA